MSVDLDDWVALNPLGQGDVGFSVGWAVEEARRWRTNRNLAEPPNPEKEKS
jgi:hypothetical protein